jgi:glycosyltransferase involved in cell wall biosynthesis
MKIVFFRHSLLSRGGDKMIVTHASYLAAAGHEVVIKTNVHDSVFILDSRVRVEKIACRWKIGTLFAAAAVKQNADVVVADIIALVPLLLLRNRSKLVYFAQDYDESYYGSLLQKFFIRSIYLFSLLLCRVPCIAVSDPLAALLRRRFAARVAVAENGVDASAFHYEPDSDLIAGKGGRKAVVMLSRSDPRKGFDIARQVGALLSGCSVPFEIWTVGEKAAGLFPGLPQRDFGYLAESRLRQVLSSADCFLYPSRHEGFPLMVLEAFACRCPVVTTRAVPYARHGHNSLLAEIGDAAGAAAELIRLNEDAVLRGSLVAEGSRLAGVQTQAKACAAFARELLGQK